MKYFRNLFYRDEKQTNKSSPKPYSVTYTTQDFPERQLRKQDLLPSLPPLNYTFSADSPTKHSTIEDSLRHSSYNQELKIQCLNSGASHTDGKVISSRGPNVNLHLADISTENVPIKKRIAYSSSCEEDPRLSQLVAEEEEITLIEDDWIVLNAEPKVCVAYNFTNNQSLLATKRLYQMALSETEQNLIKASWVPIREDPVTAGLLLFDGLFTKYPRYLSYFPQFSVDKGSMKENKRLISHAVKVIEKVTFVVDALGNEAMTSQLNEALVKLVQSHIERKIGLEEFTNLGEVLIDFICCVNYHGLARAYATSQLTKKSAGGQQVIESSVAVDNNTNNSDTMTSTLDKIRASSTTSSSSDDESYLASLRQSSGGVGDIGVGSGGGGGNINSNETMASYAERSTTDGSCGEIVGHNHGEEFRNPDSKGHLHAARNNKEIRLDFNVLVPAWRTLYKGVKDLVRQEEEAAAS